MGVCGRLNIYLSFLHPATDDTPGRTTERDPQFQPAEEAHLSAFAVQFRSAWLHLHAWWRQKLWILVLASFHGSYTAKSLMISVCATPDQENPAMAQGLRWIWS